MRALQKQQNELRSQAVHGSKDRDDALQQVAVLQAKLKESQIQLNSLQDESKTSLEQRSVLEKETKQQAAEIAACRLDGSKLKEELKSSQASEKQAQAELALLTREKSSWAKTADLYNVSKDGRLVSLSSLQCPQAVFQCAISLIALQEMKSIELVLHNICVSV